MKLKKRIHPVLQMEVTECGAASLATVLGYYGKKVPLEQLRLECGVSGSGVNAKSIVRAAALHNLKTRALRTNITGAAQLKTPAILHWNMDHFLVLCEFKKNGVLLADPAYGMRIVSFEEFSDSFTGIALEFTPDENFEKDKSSARETTFIASCIRKFIPYIFVFILLEGCAWIAGFVTLFLNSAFIDNILNKGNIQNIYAIWTLLLYAGSITLSVLALSGKIRHSIGELLNISINISFMEHIMKLPIEFFSMRSGGDLSNRENANMIMGTRLSRMLSPLTGYMIQIVLYMLLIFITDLHIAFIAVLCVAASAVCLIADSVLHEENARSYSKNMGVMQSDVSRVIEGIETVKSCGAEDSACVRLIASGCDVLNQRVKMETTGHYTDIFISFFQSLGTGIILAAGAGRIISGFMTEGTLIALQAVVAATLNPVSNALNTGMEMYGLRGEASRTDDVMRYHTEDRFLPEKAFSESESETGQNVEINGDIDLENVSFSYSPAEPPVIQGLNLHIKKGSSLAITGKSGSGKSTVAKIIAGLYCESSGTLRYNGFLRREISRGVFYSEIAVVSQSVRLFEGTILDNITMWDADISYDDAVEAAKAACIHDDILRRGMGYHERVQENGKNFSGGQRQRIELARALAKKPSVLILDEATSALDTDTERKVMNNIEELGITLIIAAHRLSTIRGCDEIIVISGGGIAERGTHEELMSMKGIYFDMLRV